jgi:hypothetical protein
VYLTGADIVDTVGQLNYRYDTDPAAMRKLPHPLVTRDFTEARPEAPAAMAEAPSKLPVQTLASSTPTKQRLRLAGTTLHVPVPLTKDASERIRTLIAGNAVKKVFLRLDDIRAANVGGVYYEVYLNPAAGATLDIHAKGYVGNLSLFGLQPHTMGGHAASSKDIYTEFDISRLVGDAIGRNGQQLDVVLVPRGLFDLRGQPLPVSTEAQGTVGSAQIVGR